MRAGRIKAVLTAIAVAMASPVMADPVTSVSSVQGELGPVTNLPMPRFVSLKAHVANARRGPSRSHRIDWVFQRRDMPLRVVGEYDNWRRVVDREGMGGWMHYSLLSGSRTVIIDRDMLVLRAQPERDASEVAMLELGVIADLGECNIDWCRLRVDGYRGWAPKAALFGVDADELRE